MTADLSIVIVNFNTAHFLGPLVESIREQVWTVEGRPGKLEIFIIDNASRGDDAALIAELVDPTVHFVQNTMNVGYGQANNQGYALATGRYHMILNPDTRFLPGCFQEMVGHLERTPESAMVGPLAYMDPLALCMMPPNEMPTPELFELQTRGQTDRAAAEKNIRDRTRFAFDYWSAKDPYPVEMLSGSCLVFRRELFRDEFPFDPGFPLYYEDTDMFMRLRRRREKLVHLPAARMLHYWSQSAGTYQRGADYRCRLSARRYYEKYFGPEGLAVYDSNMAAAVHTKDEGSHITPFEFEPLAAGAETPVFPVDPAHENFYVEFSGNPIFTLAVGLFPQSGGDFSVSQVMWDQLGPGNYSIRMIDRETLETVHAWVITKKPT